MITENFFGDSVVLIMIIFALFVLWSIVWKGMALWKSARSNHSLWFLIFLFVNTLGILEIIYIYFINRKSEVKEKLPTDKIIN